ncbi:TauD/TfdA dioxygenase family protein [Bordetella genomosp. 12]|uniref:Taurine dioxygenase n=1 Tax=Bordetella genomosp. 12 TaxID=463035 RepID=A0A261VCV1_9BORD|nr:TauD/TfdA family dioxygenase [Bordetella genomosp. 12]OZI71929.1 taurine dioxygenase [Bordetella genomosp. 12]
MSLIATELDVRPLTLHTGAEIHGLDLREDLDDATVAQIRAALLKWKVIFFRGQDLDHADQIRFGRRFGDLTVGHPVFGYVEGYPELYSVAKDRFKARFDGEQLVRPWSGWHTDITAAINPPAASILRGVDIPPYGGDTQWTNLVAAYAGLSAPLRGFVDGLRALHRFTPPEGRLAKQDFIKRLADTPLVSEHPLVRVHPETGERALFVSPSFIKQIVGLSPRESEHLLTLLFEQILKPEYIVRFKWAPGDVAFWDNRATAHRAPTDIQQSDFGRQLYRITLVGDVPVGPDGRASIGLQGDPVLAHQIAD